MATIHVEKEDADVLRMKNTTGADVVQNQLVVLGGWVGIALEAIASNAVGPFDISQGKVIQASNLTSGASTFATENQAVYLDLAGDFGDAPGVGFFKVGTLIDDKASGVIRFIKLARAVSCDDPVDIAGTVTDNDTLKYVTSTHKWTVVAV